MLSTPFGVSASDKSVVARQAVSEIVVRQWWCRSNSRAIRAGSLRDWGDDGGRHTVRGKQAHRASRNAYSVGRNNEASTVDRNAPGEGTKGHPWITYDQRTSIPNSAGGMPHSPAPASSPAQARSQFTRGTRLGFATVVCVDNLVPSTIAQRGGHGRCPYVQCTVFGVCDRR